MDEIERALDQLIALTLRKITVDVVRALTPDAMDGVLTSLEKSLSKVDVCQQSSARFHGSSRAGPYGVEGDFRLLREI